MNSKKRRRSALGSDKIVKAPTGIDGLDEITGGGLPRGRNVLIVGDAGAGKTVLTLQTLVNGARRFKEPAIFVAFEEESRQIIANAASFDWNVRDLEKRKLFFLDAMIPIDMVKSGNFDLSGLLVTLEAKVNELGAKRIAFDGIDVLLRLLDSPHLEHRELDRIQRWVRKMGLVGIFTAKSETGKMTDGGRFGYLQFMTDCVIVLHRQLDTGTLQRSIRVAKYRGSGFAGNEFSMAFSPVGIEIMGLSPIEQTSLPKATRVSVGIERLDAMLSGGVFRGSGILISGSPGTAKSTLCGAAVLAACERREKALYISFEELGTELIRNLTSVNINLKKYVASGRLVMHTLRTEAGSASEHFLKIRALLHEHQPDILVIDPISALIKVGGINNAVQITQWLLRLTKSAGVITFLTSLLEQPDASVEDAALPVSTFADCWMHLSYVVQGGERNRALTIVKARGTRHSNQVRELILSDSGITLTDVYLAGGQPLMGAARLEREALEAKTRTEFSLELENRRRNLILAEADLQARMKSMEIELETRRQELKRLSSDEENADAYKEKLLQKLRKIRGADHR